MEGIVGAGVTITPQVLERLRPSEISFNLAKHLLYTHFRDDDGFPKQHLFPQISALAGAGSTRAIWSPRACRSARSSIRTARPRRREDRHRLHARQRGPHRAVLDPYNPRVDPPRQFHHLEAGLEDRRQPPMPHQPRRARQRAGRPSSPASLEDASARARLRQEPGAWGSRFPISTAARRGATSPTSSSASTTAATSRSISCSRSRATATESDKAKAQTTRDLWVPGVNALGGYGRWASPSFATAAVDRHCAD